MSHVSTDRLGRISASVEEVVKLSQQSHNHGLATDGGLVLDQAVKNQYIDGFADGELSNQVKELIDQTIGDHGENLSREIYTIKLPLNGFDKGDDDRNLYTVPKAVISYDDLVKLGKKTQTSQGVKGYIEMRVSVWAAAGISGVDMSELGQTLDDMVVRTNRDEANKIKTALLEVEATLPEKVCRASVSRYEKQM